MRNTLTSLVPEAYECALPVHQDGTCNGLPAIAAEALLEELITCKTGRRENPCG